MRAFARVVSVRTYLCDLFMRMWHASVCIECHGKYGAARPCDTWTVAYVRMPQMRVYASRCVSARAMHVRAV
eukprot:2018510-Pleurochrysis_carterae.AAC.5